MGPGVAFFYGGLVSEKAVISTMMLSFGCMAVVTVLWGLCGYSMSFGPVAYPLSFPGMQPILAADYTPPFAAGVSSPGQTPNTRVVGNAQLALFTFGDQLRQTGWVGADGVSAATWNTPGAQPLYSRITEHAYSQFQLMFAIVTCALITGGVVGKIKYVWFMFFVAVWHLCVYCPLAHWIFFYDGWLFTYGVLDYAGGLVVHCASGVSALTLSFWLGRSRTSRHNHTEAHSIPHVLLGAGLLWFGKYAPRHPPL